MKTKSSDSYLLHAIACVLFNPNVRQAVSVRNPNLTVKVTRQRKPDRRTRSETFIVTIGKPAYREREFIKLCQRAGERFPVSKVQLKFYPAKK